MINLDATDLRILQALQYDGRISNQDLAEKVALSPSACLRVCGYWRRKASSVDTARN
ncbi:hypothetical protein PSm6_55040 [Pseudomonas solani]|uniref:HTH asnC-type domain-containing protein n=1 Tax=Pseudomonas solani TaxID=2731552 RepID=A0ABM7LHM3_9PSED|nr:hypothetical protein PSm6_55040 [Pseudomonas solani]